ncbi:MAG TPA: NAD(P)H-hydrate dehydratase [Gemmatimonadaceae bacterium]|nr:NAD(P)H-hydrate dehydratase [Gemmatimonadaceae bacterium]
MPEPDTRADKQDRGVAMVIGGAAEVPGALVLAGVAALRVGAGKLKVAGPRSAMSALGVAMPEARVIGLPETGDGFLDRRAGSRAGEVANAEAILIGPGMLNEEAIRGFMDEIIRRVADRLVVIDALALTALRGRRYRFSEDTSVVLTPNIGEMAKITGETPETISRDPQAVALHVARELNVVVTLKGSETFIASPYGEVFRYSEGDVGLATSGSGDVLAGALLGMLARGATLDQAAVWAVYMHGEAGNRLARRVGPIGFLARELCNELSPIMNALSKKKSR